LLRIYWYDGTSTGPSAQHIALAFKPRTKLRLGFVNSFGQQKGVDSLIVTDMINLARNRAMAEAVLLSGDEDLRVGVQQAQELGVKVHLLGITPCRSSQSQFLLQEVDDFHEWTIKDVSAFIQCDVVELTSGNTAPLPAAPIVQGVARAVDIKPSLETIAKESAADVKLETIAGIIAFYEASKRLPPDLDRPLLGKVRVKMGMLSRQEINHLRDSFVSSLKAIQATRAQ
jgi:hypothetical protein